MKAFVIKKYGKSESLKQTEMPEPALCDRDVRVRINAAGVNVLDSKIRDGEFKLLLPYDLPLILGNDMAGVVAEVGPGATRFTVGDEVYARPDAGRIGTFAETIAVAEDDLAMKPANISMEEAASLPLVALTAWQALVELANVQPGQKVLIHAGSGGVGTVAIQLAKHLGAAVATTCSTKNIEMVRTLGADVVIDYTRQAFEKELSDYDVVLNSLGNDTLRKSVDVLRLGGLLISISGPPDPAFADQQKANIGLRTVFRVMSFGIRRAVKKKGARYSFLFMRADGDQLTRITELVEQGILTPVIDRTFPFAETAEAVAYLHQGHAKGKVVIRMP